MKLYILRDADLTSAPSAHAPLTDEHADYSKFEINHGYGQLVKAGAALTKGVKGKIHVDITVSTYKEDSYTQATHEVRNVVDETILSHLEESESKRNHADWWLWFHSRNNSDYQHHKDETHETITDTDQTMVDALENSFSSDLENFRVSGDFEVEGQSMIPTEVFLFVEMLTIKTSDGQSVHVFNSEPIAAGSDGDTSAGKVTGGGKLNVEPL